MGAVLYGNGAYGSVQYNYGGQMQYVGYDAMGQPVLYSADLVLMQQQALRQQVEFYFSVDNLARDIFLRSHMDVEGWVPLQVVADFKRVRSMT